MKAVNLDTLKRVYLIFSNVFLILVVVALIWTLVTWGLNEAGKWVDSDEAEEAYNDFSYLWRTYLVLFAMICGAVVFRFGARQEVSSIGAVLLPVVGALLVALAYIGFQSRLSHLYDQIPTWPKHRFSHKIAFSVPEDCALKRGPEGYRVGYEFESSCTMTTQEGNIRRMKIRRRDHTFTELERYGLRISPGQELHSAFNELALENDRGRDETYWYVTLAYQALPIPVEDVPEDFVACIGAFEKRADRDDVTPDPPQYSRALEPYTLSNLEGERETEIRYRCTAWYPEFEQAINLSLTVSERYLGDTLSADFSNFAKDSFKSLRIVPE